jgi:dTDP-4-dehydrorhamnose reductase
MLLVTGASGLLGANLIYEAISEGINVVAISGSHQFNYPGVHSECADLTDKKQLYKIINKFHPSWVINCAALTDLDLCEKCPDAAFKCNSEIPRNLGLATKEIGVGLVQISTDSVFNGLKGKYSESDSPDPLNNYAKSKLSGEKEVMETNDKHLILRTNIYGKNYQNKESLAEWIVKSLKNGNAITGFSDVLFNPLLVNHLSKIILQFLDRSITGLYHVGSHPICSKYEFSLKIAEKFSLTGSNIKKGSIGDLDLRTPRPLNTSLSTRKAEEALNTKMPSLDEGLTLFNELQGKDYLHISN